MAGTPAVPDMRLALVPLPVTDVDRAKAQWPAGHQGWPATGRPGETGSRSVGLRSWLVPGARPPVTDDPVQRLDHRYVHLLIMTVPPEPGSVTLRVPC